MGEGYVERKIRKLERERGGGGYLERKRKS